eukprot:gene26783-32910_t
MHDFLRTINGPHAHADPKEAAATSAASVDGKIHLPGLRPSCLQAPHRRVTVAIPGGPARGWMPAARRSVRGRALMYQKVDQGDAGALTDVPITALDNASLSLIFGSTFIDMFEDRFFFWQCFDILRRLLQSGGVIVVQLLAGTESALVFELSIAIIALSLHLYFSTLVKRLF